MNRLKKFWIFAIVLIVAIATSIIVEINRYVPESKAEEKNTKSISVTYKSGIGEGEDVVVTQTLCDSQTQGSNDYTDGKIVLYRNGENGINFSAEQVEYNKVMYDRILTGWKLTSVMKDGTEITNFVEPENQNYADKTNANKDIGTVYAQEGWYIVPDGVTAITVEAVYARAIYVRSPFDKMYYDEVHCFYYGENSDGTTTLAGTAVAKSSDNNDGSTVEKAVSTLKRAYELMTASDTLTVYDTAFVLCGDMYEINYHPEYSKYATGTAGTFSNYSSQNFGYNWYETKPVTITNSSDRYNFYTISPSYDFNNYSSLRLDGLYFAALPIGNVKKVHSELSATIGTYVRTRQFNFYNSNSMYETTETVETDMEYVQIRYRNMKYMKLNGGYWNPVNNYNISGETLNKSNYIQIGGKANINVVTTGGYNNGSNIEGILTNPVSLIVTGGRITEGIYGTAYVQGGSVKGNVNIFISGGYISNVYGGGNGSTYANGEEKGNVNIDITGGIFGNIYGGGQYYTSKISGDINLSIENAIINDNIFGGGRGGQVLGSTNLILKNTTVKGNLFGGGLGVADGIKVKLIEYYSSQSFEQNKKAYNEKAASIGDVNWEEAPNNFPSYNEETAEIEGRRYHCYDVANGSLYFYEIGIKYFLTLANVKNNINIDIENSTIEQNIYGGASIGLVEGNINLKLKNTNVNGNVYGGGDGKSTPSTINLYSPIQDYKELTSQGMDNNPWIGSFSWTSDKDILTYFKGIYDGKNKVIYNSDNTTTAFSELSEEAQAVAEKYGTKQLVYSSDVEKLGFVEGDITVNIDGGTYKKAVYGGGNNGQVKGNVTLELANISSDQNVYTGGNTGNVEKGTSLTINSGTYANVFGGGYSGKVLGDSTVTINKGTCANIFGGGDQSYVQGNANVTIGQENSSNVINVTGLVYGGGRGYDANNDGDASDFTTVYGNSTVLVQGINTLVENYGSTKLGAVAGNVDVNFKNYWSGNSTAKYKTMNGIDRATTVSFNNSYVLLENKDSSGNLVGIQSIKNLVIPKGSGLKISANGEITGNFEGGGELYLDSLVCLTVKGNITGQTTMILNPKLLEDGNQVIKGGITVPYLKVGGTAPEKIALVSGEANRYKIIQANKETVKEEIGEDYIYYYIAKDVIVQNNITVETNSIENRKYKDKITNTNDVLILNTGTFTTDYNISYYLTDDAYKAKDYSNISRKLKLISNTDKEKVIIMPVGTEITMIIDGKYYSYVVNTENLSEISLSDFTNNESSTKYDELKDITNSELVDKSLNEINGTTTYTFKENYKFIINFTNTKGIEVDRYYPSLEVYYGQTSFGDEKKDVANNIVDIQKREYTLDLVNDRTYYEPDKKINLNGTLKIGSLKENTYLPTKDLDLKINLKDSTDNIVKIPEGAQVVINNNYYQVKDGQVICKLLDNLSTSTMQQSLDINLDMSNILPQDRITKGDYKIEVEYLNSKQYEKLTENNISIISKQTEYGVSTDINLINGIENTQIQLISGSQEENRSIKVKYSNLSELNNMKIKIKAVERTGEFEYKETANSKNKIDIDTTELNVVDEKDVEQNINITFKKELQKGTYRILVELYDEFGELRTSDYVNFIVD